MTRVRSAPAVAAAALAAAGVVVTFWRPLAPDLGAVATDLDRLPPDVAEAIRQYRQPRVVAALLLEVVGLAVPLLFVATRAGRRLLARLAGDPHDGRHPAVRGALIGVVIAATGVIAGLPVRAWAGIVQDGAWQIRTASAPAWWGRVATSVGLNLLIIALAAAALVWLVRRRPSTWPADVVVVGVGGVALITLLWPVAVLPLTTPVGPLGEGATAEAVEETVAAAGLGDVPIVVAARSHRDVRRNAVVHGLGPSRRVVVDDTLLERPVDEVVAVVAHELAHHQHRDVERGVLGAAIGVALLAALVRWAWGRPRVRAAVAGVDAAPHDPRLVAVVLAVLAVATPVLEPVALWQSRRVEAAADAAAHDLGATPATTIQLQRRLAIDNLSPLEVSTWVQVRWRTHPSGADRIRAAVALARRDGLELPTRQALEDAEGADPPAWSPPEAAQR